MKLNLKAHLESRGVELNRYNLFLDEHDYKMTTLLHNFKGDMVGYHVYNPLTTQKKVNNAKEGRYFTYKPKETLAVFGLEQLDFSQRRVYVVEGFFKATALHSLNRNALAVLTATPKPMKNQFLLLECMGFELYAVGDNDHAGQKLVNCVGKGSLSPKDLDEMTTKERLEFILQLE